MHPLIQKLCDIDFAGKSFHIKWSNILSKYFGKTIVKY